MFDTLFKGVIHGRVMSTLKARIANAEQKHADKCAELDEEHEQKVADLEDELDAAKEAHADEMVSSILGR